MSDRLHVKAGQAVGPSLDRVDREPGGDAAGVLPEPVAEVVARDAPKPFFGYITGTLAPGQSSGTPRSGLHRADSIPALRLSDLAERS